MTQIDATVGKGMAIVAMTVAVSLACLANPAAADEPNYQGKTVSLVVSSAPGGGTDIIARLIATAMSKYLPGQPAMVYKIMPAAGGTAGLSWFASQAPADGLTFFIGAGNQLSPVVLRRPEVKYDPTKLEIIGGFVNPSNYLLVRPQAVKQLTDSSASPIHMAVLDGTRSGDLLAMWGAEALGWNISLVFGYTGTSSMSLALQRGEVDAMSNNDLAVVAPLVKEGQVTLVVQTGELDHGKVVPSGAFPQPPLLSELMLDKLDARARAAFNVWERQAQIGKWFALPPNTPASHVRVYREAFQKAAAEPDFQARVAQAIAPDIKEMAAEDMIALIQEMVSASDESLDFLDKLTAKYRK